jgi:ribosomal protein S18 acetylase RimI-like enzyme
MDITFCKGNDLTENEKKKIVNFCKEPFNEETKIFNKNIIGILKNIIEKKIIGIVFLLPEINFLKNDNKELYNNLIKQGVKDGDCYLYNFCILKTERKKGYGFKLLEECHKYLKKIYKRIILFVDSKNSGAIYLYNKAKYKVHLASPDGFIMKNNLN